MTSIPIRSPIFRDRLPPARPGMRIGLFGGTFDPPHPGHRAVSVAAMRRLKLDQVWWVVSPQNPLKQRRPTALGSRLAAAAAAAAHPRIAVTGVEDALGLIYTVDLLRFMRRRLPGVRLVWLMGADNLASFHRWRGWREIAAILPVAVLDRPDVPAPLAAPAARALASARIRARDAAALAAMPPPAWVFLYGPRLAISSTGLRSKRAHQRRS